MAEKLVLMVKDGEKLKVHPSCVKAHEAVGWKRAKEEKAPPKAKPEKPAKGA